MAFPTSLNNQITDLVSQSNVETLGTSPAFMMGAVYQAASLALATAAQNAAFAHQQAYVVAQATTASTVTQLQRFGDRLTTARPVA